MDAPIFSKDGQEIGRAILKEEVFGKTVHPGVIQQVEIAILAGLRRGTASTKTKGEVSGGGKKPWKQKGTGQARQGSIRAPHWRGGGITFGPHPRSYKQLTPKKLKDGALLGALTDKAFSGKIIILEEVVFKNIKTKEMAVILKKISGGEKALLVLSKVDLNIIRSSRNIPGVKINTVQSLNLHDILNAKNLIIEKSALPNIGEFACRN